MNFLSGEEKWKGGHRFSLLKCVDGRYFLVSFGLFCPKGVWPLFVLAELFFDSGYFCRLLIRGFYVVSADGFFYFVVVLEEKFFCLS